MNFIQKNLSISLIIFTALFLLPNKILAQSESVCGEQSSGFCMVEGQICPDGDIISDPECTSNPYNGKACCITPESEICGTIYEAPNGALGCNDKNNEPIYSFTQCPKNSNSCCNVLSGCDSVIPIENIIDGPDNNFFNALNPLRVENSSPQLADQLSTPGGIVSRLLQFLFPLAGLVLFVMLIWGGFEILSKSTQGTKALDAGKNRITAAIVGFLLLFATYWMAQIIEAVFGIVIV